MGNRWFVYLVATHRDHNDAWTLSFLTKSSQAWKNTSCFLTDTRAVLRTWGAMYYVGLWQCIRLVQSVRLECPGTHVIINTWRREVNLLWCAIFGLSLLKDWRLEHRTQSVKRHIGTRECIVVFFFFTNKIRRWRNKVTDLTVIKLLKRKVRVERNADADDDEDDDEDDDDDDDDPMHATCFTAQLVAIGARGISSFIGCKIQAKLV